MIYCLIGPPASGKTTLAYTMVRYMNAVIISRDSLREHLFGYRPEQMGAYYDREDVASLEKAVNKYQDALVKQSLKLGKDVILDNTHLKLTYINQLKQYNAPIKFIPVETDLQSAIERDALRSRVVGEDFIKKAFGEMEHLKKTFDFKDWQPENVGVSLWAQNHNPANGSAFIFDIDGTLALNTTRSPYDYKRVGEDAINPAVKKVYDTIEEFGYDIIICTGRPSDYREQTEAWLAEHGIRYDKLYMRPAKDQRKDYIVKEEMWRQILKTHNVIAMFDDRDQVVQHGRRLGFDVFQVNNGDF